MTEVFWHLVAPDQPIISLTLPLKLYYVRHRYSQAYATDDGGFVSRAPDRDISAKKELKRNVEMHFVWDNRNWESCFISAFGDIAHAVRWARERYAPVKVYELDTQKLPQGTLVLNVFMLCTFLGIDYEYNKNKDQFLFYRGIPGTCVERSLDSREYIPELLSPSQEFKSQWVDAIRVAEREETLRKGELTVSRSDVGTQQGHGVEVESRKTSKSASQVRRERQKRKEELKRQKSAESNINTMHDSDVNDLAGQMEVLDLETTSLKYEPSSTTATLTTTPNDGAISTTTPPRMSATQLRKKLMREREMKKLELQKSAESNNDTVEDTDVNHPTGAGEQMKVLDFETNP